MSPDHDPSRREALVGLTGLVAAAGPAGGPSLFLVPGDGPTAGWSDFARHRAAGTAPGLDFAATVGSLVYPMAEGIVVVSTFDRISGHVVVLDHAPWQTRYAHMEQRLVSVGERVPRARPLGRAGASGLGAGLGPHLHVDLHVELVYRYLLDRTDGVEVGPHLWFDPVSFAAEHAIDAFGNRTLPWPGDRGRALDAVHRHDALVAARRLRAWLPPGFSPDPDPAFPSAATPQDLRFRGRIRAAVGDPEPRIQAALRAWVAVRPALTSPVGR